ncbi:hypothetical protein CPT_Maja_008 [Burkholderia phage Maja]|uniref:Uncharacterized protein n=1 Tax=Burkholderia phage Maja TaxID=2767571 RepID=A0A7S6U1S5_9CAUD|nr:hypothetical protein CPT_Maja_008 [Burkholderia phage Maja]
MQTFTNEKSGFFDQLADAYEDIKEAPFFRPQWVILDVLILAAVLLT